MQKILFPHEISSEFGDHLRVIQERIAAYKEIDLHVLDEVRFVFICYTNRCGSNFLAECIASNRTYNLAEEFLNSGEVLRVASQHSLSSVTEYIRGVVRHRAIDNVFVSKIGLPHLTVLYESKILEQIFNRSYFVFVERSDKLGQAISHAIAEQTQAWASYNSPEGSEPPVYNREAVLKYLRSITRQNFLFECFFALNGITPARVIYENFERHPVGSMDDIFAQIGLPHPGYNSTKVRTERQRNEMNAAWRKQFLQHAC